MSYGNMLRALSSYSHSYHNVRTWADGSDALLAIGARAMNDRFWQSGISSGTRDDFYAKVSSTKATMEGFASTLRGALRSVREACYSLLYCMSRLQQQFYSYDDLPGPLARALFTDAAALSPHQFSTLISIARYIVDDCPKDRRELFLTPILSELFIQVDSKITSEWSEIEQKTLDNSEDDDLNEEMKEESVLRHLTYSGVLMVAGLLDPQRDSTSEKSSEWTY